MKPPPSPPPLLGVGEHHLAADAVRDEASRGRRWAEPPHAFRAPFQRDRDRVIHSRAFRRLEGKTQVFLSGSGDHYRTRLTHTIEVAAIARTLARRLWLNEDLTEAIALAHDLGHTPFGHVGERVLHELLLEDLGGFDHNAQSLRIVDVLECKYPGIQGLNLTWEVRTGLIKHRTPASALDGSPLPLIPGLEAQVADVADDLAYYTHDVDDGLESGLFDEADLETVGLWQLARDQARASGADPRAAPFRGYVIRCLIDRLVGDVIDASLAGVTAPASTPAPAGTARRIGFSAALKPRAEELRTFLFANVYHHPEVLEVNRRMGNVVRGLCRYFLAHPDALGISARERADREGLLRAVADYVAGMTDRYALKLHAEFCRDNV